MEFPIKFTVRFKTKLKKISRHFIVLCLAWIHASLQKKKNLKNNQWRITTKHQVISSYGGCLQHQKFTCLESQGGRGVGGCRVHLSPWCIRNTPSDAEDLAEHQLRVGRSPWSPERNIQIYTKSIGQRKVGEKRVNRTGLAPREWGNWGKVKSPIRAIAWDRGEAFKGTGDCISWHVTSWMEWESHRQSLPKPDIPQTGMQMKSLSCVWLCDPMDCSLPGSSVNGIFQARILEWVAISFSRKSSQPRDWTQISCIVGRCFTIWATREGQVCKSL